MKLSVFYFLIAVFATFRVSLLFTKESGPAKIFAKLRRTPPKKSATHDWLTCLWCFSMTASAVSCGLLWLAGVREHWAVWFLVWCALSAITILIRDKMDA